MKTLFISAVLLIVAFSMNFAATKITIEHGNTTYHIGDGLGSYEWNEQWNDDVRCWNGTKQNCWFEICESVNVSFTFDPSELSTFDISGTLERIDVTITREGEEDLNLQAQSSNFVVPDCYLEIPYDNYIPGLEAGDIIDIPEFQTDDDGNYTVTGTLRN